MCAPTKFDRTSYGSTSTLYKKKCISKQWKMHVQYATLLICECKYICMWVYWSSFVALWQQDKRENMYTSVCMIVYVFILKILNATVWVCSTFFSRLFCFYVFHLPSLNLWHAIFFLSFSVRFFFYSFFFLLCVLLVRKE